MKYMGSKARIAKDILAIILKERKQDQYYVEPFAGGMNIIDKVSGNRIANDLNSYLISMFEALCSGWRPEKIDKEFYNLVKLNKDKFDPYITGWVGFNCSYSGKWFGGYAGEVKTKIGTVRDYQQEAINNTLKQITKLNQVLFCNKQYFELQIPENSIIYCDPPYQGTTEYKDSKFDSLKFWGWVRDMSISGHSVFVSEYNAPEDFECIWSKDLTSQLSANGKCGGSKVSTEKLFKLK